MTTYPVAQFLQQRIAASGLPYETLAKKVGLKIYVTQFKAMTKRQIIPRNNGMPA